MNVDDLLIDLNDPSWIKTRSVGWSWGSRRASQLKYARLQSFLHGGLFVAMSKNIPMIGAMSRPLIEMSYPCQVSGIQADRAQRQSTFIDVKTLSRIKLKPLTERSSAI